MYWERIRKTRENRKKKDKKTKRFTTKKRNYDYCGNPDNVFQIQESWFAKHPQKSRMYLHAR